MNKGGLMLAGALAMVAAPIHAQDDPTGYVLGGAALEGAFALLNPFGSGPRTVDATQFDIAGVKLGMTPEEARAALKAKGFVPNASDPRQDSWSARVSTAAAERGRGPAVAGTIPQFTMAFGPAKERVEVWYAPTPTGARAATINYVIDHDRITPEAFIKGLGTRYGKPTTATGHRGSWCNRSERECGGLAETGQLPMLAADVDRYTLYSLKLSEGSRAADQRKASLASAIDAAAPRDAKVSF